MLDISEEAGIFDGSSGHSVSHMGELNLGAAVADSIDGGD